MVLCRILTPTSKAETFATIQINNLSIIDTTTSTDKVGDKNTSALSVGVVAALGFGLTLCLAIVVVLVACLYRQRKRIKGKYTIFELDNVLYSDN